MVCKYTLIKELQKINEQAYYFRDTARDLFLRRKTDGQYEYVATSASVAKIKEVCKKLSVSCSVHTRIKKIVSELLVDNKIIVSPFIKTKVKNSYASRSYSNKIEDMIESQDFTINSFAYDPVKKIMKFFPGADKDAKNKLIKMLQSPNKKITENRLYMLEAGKLLADLGQDWQVDFDTYEEIKLRSLEIAIVSPESVRDIFSHIMKHSNKPSLAFRFYLNSGLLQETLPQLIWGVGLPQSNKSSTLDLFDHIMFALDSVKKTKNNYEAIRWACVFHDIAKPYTKSFDAKGNIHFYGHDTIGAIFATRWMEAYKFNKNLTQKVSILCKHHLFNISPKLDEAAVLRLIKRVGKEHIYDLLDLRVADRLGTGRKDISMKRVNWLRAKIKTVIEKA